MKNTVLKKQYMTPDVKLLLLRQEDVLSTSDPRYPNEVETDAYGNTYTPRY